MQGGDGWSTYSVQKVISTHRVHSVQTTLGQRTADYREILPMQKLSLVILGFLRQWYTNLGKWAYLLRLNSEKKINSTLISVELCIV